MNTKRNLSAIVFGAALVLIPVTARGQQTTPDQNPPPRQDNSAGQDMHNAGHETQNAGRDAGQGTKKGTKKAYHKTKKGTKKAYNKSKNTTKGAVQGGKQGAQQPQ